MTSSALARIIDAHADQATSYEEGLDVRAVLARCGIEMEGDGAPDGGLTRHDRECEQLATLVVRLGRSIVHATETAAVVPPVALRDAIAEPYVCPNCDRPDCVCAAYLPHPGHDAEWMKLREFLRTNAVLD